MCHPCSAFCRLALETISTSEQRSLTLCFVTRKCSITWWRLWEYDTHTQTCLLVGHKVYVSCQSAANVALDCSPVRENVRCVARHPLAQRSWSRVSMMMWLTSTFLFLLCYVNNFKCITLRCFLLLCVWHAAYVNWWDIKWVCLRSYKYIDCEGKQPNNQGLFWLNCQSVAWKILQKLIMTCCWQWHENHFWISYCFFEDRRQEWVSIATCFFLQTD